MENINTSRAQYVSVDIFDYDNLPLSAVYTDKSNANAAIDLTDWKFRFILKERESIIKEYLIDAGDLTSTYIDKTGADLNVLDMKKMWEDIRDAQVKVSEAGYRLVQVVTDDDDETYTHIDYTINGKRY